MRRTIGSLVFAVLIFASVSAAASRPAVRRCGPVARTLAADPVARVYQVRAGVYGCAIGSSRRFLLVKGSLGIARQELGPLALAGCIAAYGVAVQGVDTRSTSVVVRRLSDGVELHTDPGTSRNKAPEFIESVNRVVVEPDGDVAWTSTDRSIVSNSAELEVDKHDSGGQAVLDSGPGVDVASLRLRGRRVSWRDNGKKRLATLK